MRTRDLLRKSVGPRYSLSWGAFAGAELKAPTPECAAAYAARRKALPVGTVVRVGDWLARDHGSFIVTAPGVVRAVA